jgi:hypothetical protein
MKHLGNLTGCEIRWESEKRYRAEKELRIGIIGCPFSLLDSDSEMPQLLICRTYVNFRVKIGPMYKIRWYSSLGLRFFKGICGASGRTYCNVP